MKERLPIRLSHLLRYCSVGAILRGPHALMTVMDTRHWTDRNGNAAGRPLRYVDRVRSALEIKQKLREPPIARERSKGRVDGVCVPARKFPRWAQCPHCGLLHFLPSLEDKDSLPKCREENRKKCPHTPRLEQVTDVLVHEEGYMDDVPWHYLAHWGSEGQEQSQCKQDNFSYYLRLLKPAEGKRYPTLVCTRCGAGNPFIPYKLGHPVKHMRKQPWINETVELQTPPRILRVNEIQVHIPHSRNALVIPPESRILQGTVVDRLYSSMEKRRSLEGSKTKLQQKSAVRRIATEYRSTPEAVQKAWQEIQKGYPLYGNDFNVTPGQLREDEYKALLEVIPDVSEDEDFVTHHQTEEWRKLGETFSKTSAELFISKAVNRLVTVNRLKEIMVFEGFSRIHGDDGKIVRPDIVGESDWLPAVELFGEGIFFTFDEGTLSHWESIPEIVSRSNVIQKRYEAASEIFNSELTEVSPRFLLLHTFAHLLIRQLECDSGYPTASLKERIYCGTGNFPMAGILIYVAVPDIVGSLGGIIEMAEPRRFMVLASKAVDHSKWCSLDPVCSEHEGQGLNLLNRAACHACLLVPEPSCDYRNALLDRIFVKGDAQKGIPGFFQTLNHSGDASHGKAKI